MILLDTDIVSLLHAGHERVVERIAKVDSEETLGTTIVTRAEIIRARSEFLLKAANGDQLQRAQERMQSSESLLRTLYIATIDLRVAELFDQMRSHKKRNKIGRADMLIACTCLANQALLVTRNVKHFRQIPDLKIENWAD